ncbi:hypothetical protein BJV74DRAFT_467302 [Russula compacta]|nr:hypothetical protein BJV74DRAFT_467302 [Russula compacta]
MVLFLGVFVQPAEGHEFTVGHQVAMRCVYFKPCHPGAINDYLLKPRSGGEGQIMAPHRVPAQLMQRSNYGMIL